MYRGWELWDTTKPDQWPVSPYWLGTSVLTLWSPRGGMRRPGSTTSRLGGYLRVTLWDPTILTQERSVRESVWCWVQAPAQVFQAFRPITSLFLLSVALDFREQQQIRGIRTPSTVSPAETELCSSS